MPDINLQDISIILHIIIFSLFSYPLFVLIHEYGHAYAIKKISKKLNLQINIQAYLYFWPFDKITAGGTKAKIINPNSLKSIELTDYLDKNKHYKELIQIFQSGIRFQISFLLIFNFLFLIIYFIFQYKQEHFIMLILSFDVPQILLIVISYLFISGNNNNLSDRQQIKKYKKMVKGQ